MELVGYKMDNIYIMKMWIIINNIKVDHSISPHKVMECKVRYK